MMGVERVARHERAGGWRGPSRWLCMVLAVSILIASCLPAGQVEVSGGPDTVMVAGLGGGGGGGPGGGGGAAPARPATPAPGMNAMMTVIAWRGKVRLKRWSGPVMWSGPVRRYGAAIKNGLLHWELDHQIENLRVETDAQGNGGIPLRKWLPAGATRVTIDIAVGYGTGAGAGAGKRKRASGSSEASRPDSRARGKAGRISSSRGHAGSAGRPGSPRGRPDGSAEGQAGGASERDGGVRDTYSGGIHGERFGDPEGGTGGDGARGDHGARGAMALFGGLIGVSRAYRAAVEVGLIAADELSPAAALKRVMKRGIRGMTVLQMREQIRREAAKYAGEQASAFRKRFLKMFKKMDPAEQQKVLTSTEQMFQRKFFARAEQGGRDKREALLRKRRKAPQGDLKELKRVEDAAAAKPVQGRLPRNHEYAGKVYPTANIDARRYPEAIAAIKRKRRAGVRFTREGYPDFTPWTYTEGRVPADVRITYRRKRGRDFRAADEAMRKKLRDPDWEAPDGYTWHHHEDVGRMVLVPEQLHRSIRDTGGIPRYRMTTGDYDAYQQVQK